MSKRKTVDVAYLVERCNKMLRLDTVSDDFRKGVSSVLESVLHHTGNYKGYNYIKWCDEGGWQRWREDSSRAGADLPTDTYIGNKTRRFYYMDLPTPTANNDLAYPERLK